MAKQLSEFEREFAKARANKQKTFPWRGKVYTTEYKEEKAAREAKTAKAEPDLKMRTAAEEAADDAKIAESMKKDAAKETPAAIPLKKPASKPTTRTETKAAKSTPEPKVWSSPRATPSAPSSTRIEPVMGKDSGKPVKSSSTRIEPTMGRGGGGMGGTLDPGTSPKGLRREPRFASGGAVKSASKRADGCAQRGFTKGRIR